MSDTDKAAQDERERKILDSHVSQLMEHFDTVQILVSKSENGATWSQDRGDGNVLARIAQCRELVMIDDERIRWKARKQGRAG